MSGKMSKDIAASRREAGKAFQRAGKRKPVTEYEQAQEALQKKLPTFEG